MAGGALRHFAVTARAPFLLVGAALCGSAIRTPGWRCPSEPTLPYATAHTLGEHMALNPALAGIRAARNPPGRLGAFAQGADGALWHIWQTAPGR